MTTSVRPGIAAAALRRGACLTLLLTVSAVASAQVTGTIVGTVRDSAGTAVAGAEVTVAGTRLRAIADSAGAFRLSLVPGGEQRVRARRLGFRLRELPATVTPERPTELRFVLARLAQELSTVVVQAKVDQRARHLAGFYERRKMGQGRYITQDRIDARNTNSLQDLLTGELPGIRVVSTRTIPQAIRLRGNSCPPLVWIDNMPTPAAEFDLGTIDPHTVAAVEVYYGPATVPGEFQFNGGLHACGAIVVWSRLGGDGPRAPRRAKRAPSLDSALAELRVYAADEVDQPAQVDSSRLQRPAYPDSLFAYRAQGRVVAEFVIDTTGEVREGSFGVVEATHPMFAESTRRAVMASRFVPARLRGRPVPQVILLPFDFTLGDGRR